MGGPRAARAPPVVIDRLSERGMYTSMYIYIRGGLEVRAAESLLPSASSSYRARQALWLPRLYHSVSLYMLTLACAAGHHLAEP